jgi:hypothetical protein
MGIKLFNSSPYYAQANGQAEASNKIMIKLVQKKIDQKPRRWHSVLSEALWAYRMAPHGATYQRAMNLIFHDLLGIIVEVYINDIVVKSAGDDSHLADLRLAFEKMRRYKLKMNPLKCAFGVSARKFFRLHCT